MTTANDDRRAWSLLCSMFREKRTFREANYGADYAPVWEMLSKLGAINAADYPRGTIECTECREMADLGYDKSGMKICRCRYCGTESPVPADRLNAWTLNVTWLARQICLALGLMPERIVPIIKDNAMLLGQVKPSKSENLRPVFLVRDVLAVMKDASAFDELDKYGEPILITADSHLKEGTSPPGLDVLRLEKMFFLNNGRIHAYGMNLSGTILGRIVRPVHGPFSEDFLVYFNADGTRTELVPPQACMFRNLHKLGGGPARAEYIMPEGVAATKPFDLFKVSSKGDARIIEEQRLAIYKRHVSCPNKRKGEYILTY